MVKFNLIPFLRPSSLKSFLKKLETKPIIPSLKKKKVSLNLKSRIEEIMKALLFQKGLPRR